MFKRKRGPTLPDSLRNELVSSGSIAAKTARGPGDRKRQRQQNRADKKQRRASHHSAPKPKPAVQAPAKAEVSTEERPRKRVRIEEPKQEAKDKTSRAPLPKSTPLSRLLDKTDGASSSKHKNGIRKPQDEHEKMEDAKIAWLENQLKNSKDEDENDGLDDLLADLDGLEGRLFDPAADAARYANGDPDESESEMDEEVSGELEESEDELEDSEDVSAVDEDELDGDVDLEEAREDWDGLESAGEESVDAAPEAVAEPAAPAPGRYVPPHLRKAAATAPAAKLDEPASDPRLRRLMLGLLNRISAANMQTVLPELEALYRAHPRAIVNATLIELLVVSLVGARDEIGGAFLVSYAALVAALSRTIGKEAGASFVAKAVEQLETARKADAEDEGKRSVNLVSFLSELYNFQVIACTLIYDLIRDLIGGGLAEADVELLLRIIKGSGQQLRQDDPTSLKQIIQSVDCAAGSSDAPKLGSRGRFLVETLVNLRNNRLKAETGPAAEASTSLRKFLGALSKQRSALAPEPLRLTLADLRSATSKGKWWLVGAAWAGDTLAEVEPQTLNVGSSAKETSSDQKWLALARKQGMNTEVRRSIFVALMGSEDYVDAFDRIVALGLKEVQQREAVRVILHCIGNEKAYNPFYTLVMQRLLSNANPASRSFQITLQYALWDLLREMGETEVGGTERLAADDGLASTNKVSDRRAKHLARAYGWWIAKGQLGLHVLKPVPFKTLQPQSSAWLQQMLLSVLLGTQTTSPLLTEPPKSLKRDQTAIEKVFLKVAQHEKLSKGLRHYLTRELVTEDENAFTSWAARVAASTLKVGASLNNDVQML